MIKDELKNKKAKVFWRDRVCFVCFVCVLCVFCVCFVRACVRACVRYLVGKDVPST